MPGPMIEVDINDDGDVSVHAVGHRGPKCKKHVDAFKGAFGKTVQEGKKPEYNQPEVNRNLTGTNVRVG